jgi:hypothetical protein
MVIDEYCPSLKATNVMTLNNLDRVIDLLRTNASLFVVPRHNTDYTLTIEDVHVRSPQDGCAMPSENFVCLRKDHLRTVSELLHQTDREQWGTEIIAENKWPSVGLMARWVDADEGSVASSVTYNYVYDNDEASTFSRL